MQGGNGLEWLVPEAPEEAEHGGMEWEDVGPEDEEPVEVVGGGCLEV